MARKMDINEVIVAVKAAATEAEVRAILEGCTKAQIEEVFFSIVGRENRISLLSLKKAELIERYAPKLAKHNTLEALKAMTEAEKREKLIALVKGQYFGMYALKVIAEHLKIKVIAEYPCIEDIEEYPYQELDDPDYFDYVHAIVKELEKCEEPSKAEIKAVVSYEDTEAIRTRLGRIAYAQFEERTSNLFVKAILKSIEEETLEEYQAALAEYAKTESPEKEEVRAELIVRCGSSKNPVRELTKLVPISLMRMLDKAGLYVDECGPVECAIKLLNWAGIKVIGDMPPVCA